MATKQSHGPQNPSSKPHTRPTSPPALRKNKPLSPLAQKMLADLQLAGLGERTQESYLRSVRKFAQWLAKAPDQATENDLRRYLLHIKNDQQWEGNSPRGTYGSAVIRRAKLTSRGFVHACFAEKKHQQQ